MKFEYRAWDEQAEERERRLRDLLKLYRMLLQRTAGDVDEALDWLDEIAERHDLWGQGITSETFRRLLEEHGQIERHDEGGFQLTPRGEQSLRRQALEDVFGDLLDSRSTPGEHHSRITGPGGDREPTVRPYEFGDELWSIAANETLTNAVRRSFAQGQELSVREEDLSVYETDYTAQCATALLVDCSHSMILYGEDRMTPARNVALGLIELIKKRYPRDRLHVIAFGDDAVEVPLSDVPYLNWGPYHTNTKAALEMARTLLMRSRCPNRQIFLITDGKPTVLDEGGRRLIDSGWLNPRIVNRTLDEAAQCRRKRIPITTFMVTEDPVLIRFVEELTEINQGRAYYTGLGKLGRTLLVDYVKNRRRSV
ncbi:MAG: VWA domain-containing protein [Planctomycetes bacterium]|nr:VWA domain-containing protein [Planctomycetota bacterium]